MLPENSVGKSSLPLGDSLENLDNPCLIAPRLRPPASHDILPLLTVFPHLVLPFISYLALIHNHQRDSTRQPDLEQNEGNMELKELQQEHEDHRFL